MPDSVYRVTEVIGVSGESWEAAAQKAVQTAASTVRDLRVAEVVRQDVVIENGQVSGFRVRLAISFKYESGDEQRSTCRGGEVGSSRINYRGQTPRAASEDGTRLTNDATGHG